MTEKKKKDPSNPSFSFFPSSFLLLTQMMTSDEIVECQKEACKMVTFGFSDFSPNEAQKLYWEHLHKIISFNQKQRENGGKGGRPKKSDNPGGNPNHNPNENPDDNPDIKPNETSIDWDRDSESDRDKEIGGVGERGEAEDSGVDGAPSARKKTPGKPPVAKAVGWPFLFAKPTLIRWMEYKRQRGERYKSAESLRMLEKKLRELSGSDELVAEKIVEQSMANNWAGLFPLKTDDGKAASGRLKTFREIDRENNAEFWRQEFADAKKIDARRIEEQKRELKNDKLR